MPQLEPPPYQDAADSHTWLSWYRQINDLLSGVSLSINNIDDVTIVGAETGDFLSWTDEGVWENLTTAQTIEVLGLDTDDTVTFDVVNAEQVDAVELFYGGVDTDVLYAEAEHAHTTDEVVTATTSATATDHEVAAGQRWILVDASSNAVTVDLLAAATAGDGYRIDIKVINADNTVTVEGTIDESTDAVLGLYDNISLLCDGNEYWIL